MTYREARNSAGLTMNEAASEIGVSRTALWLWETGRGNPLVENLVKMAKVYNIPTSSIDVMVSKQNLDREIKQDGKDDSINRTCSVYAIYSRTTKKIYIGSSFRPDERVRQHMSQLRKGKKTFLNPATRKREKTPWQNDYEKYGEDDFVFYVLEQNIPITRRRVTESKWVGKYNATNPRFGYNYDPIKLVHEIHWTDGFPPESNKKEATDGSPDA